MLYYLLLRFVCQVADYHRDHHVLTHSFPTRRLSDLPYQPPRGVWRPFRLDRGVQIVNRLVLPPFAADHVAAMCLQPQNIGRPLVEPAQVQEFGDALFPQSLDVERAAADEMAQALELLGVADQAAGAADVDLALLGDRLAVANRAMVGEDRKSGG